MYVSLTGTSANKIFYIHFLSSRGEYKELDTSYSNLKIDPGFPAVKLTRQSKPELIRVSSQLTRLLPELNRGRTRMPKCTWGKKKEEVKLPPSLF